MNENLSMHERSRQIANCPQLRRSTCILIGLAMLVTSGCFGPQDDTIPVWGKITIDGKPVPSGDIEFSSVDKSGFRRGTLVADGEYRTAPLQGLVPGEFLVRIFSVPGGSDKPTAGSMPGDDDGLGPVTSRDLIPAKYNMRSKLTIQVTQEGSHEFNFDLSSK